MSATTFPTRIGKGPFRHALVLESPDPTLDDHLRAAGIEPFRPEEAPDEDDLIRILEQAPYELIFKRSRVPITPRVLDAAPHLFGVMLACIGDDSVDKVACADRGVLVFNDPVSNAQSVNELTFGNILSLARRGFHAVDETRSHHFGKSQKQRYEIYGKTLGIFGLGNIGKLVAKTGEALGMKIAFYDNRPSAVEVGKLMGWTEAKDVEALFKMSDIVTAHVSAVDYQDRDNSGVLTYEHFKAMGDKDYDSPRIFINVARGNIHTSDDLLRAVEEGHVRQAMVDVFPEEPRNAADDWTNPYADNPNIFGTPHIGAATLEAQPRIAAHIGRTTRDFSYYGSVRNCVFAPQHEINVPAAGYNNILTVVHSSERGTKRAVAESIYNAGASSLVSTHRDFEKYGVAYEIIATDKPLSDDEIQEMIQRGQEHSKADFAIRAVRQVQPK